MNNWLLLSCESCYVWNSSNGISCSRVYSMEDTETRCWRCLLEATLWLHKLHIWLQEARVRGFVWVRSRVREEIGRVDLLCGKYVEKGVGYSDPMKGDNTVVTCSSGVRSSFQMTTSYSYFYPYCLTHPLSLSLPNPLPEFWDDSERNSCPDHVSIVTLHKLFLRAVRRYRRNEHHLSRYNFEN